MLVRSSLLSCKQFNKFYDLLFKLTAFNKKKTFSNTAYNGAFLY